MGIEIERKFLVRSNEYRNKAKYIDIQQGFLSIDKERVIRVRISGDKAYLTVKGYSVSIARPEFEYDIPRDEAQNMLDNICIKPIIEKRRFLCTHGKHQWEVDEFTGLNEGLVIAEIELESTDEQFQYPPWLGEEVSGDERYFNANLVKNPFIYW
jgi:adenylate cyclase